MKKESVKRNSTVLGVVVILVLSLTALHACTSSPAATRTVESGSIWVVSETAELTGLVVEEGATIEAPEGFSVTMTVDSVETDIDPGSYQGDIVLTKTEANPIKYKENTIHDFRQALYLDAGGVVAAKSVLPAAGDYVLNDGLLTGVHIESVGEDFNGIYAAGGDYTIKDLVLSFNGNGGNDFAGFGAGVMADGSDTTLVLDSADIECHGVVRTTLVANNGSHLIVKDSDIRAFDGVQDPDYLPNTVPGSMKNVPWMLGLAGNCRATNLLGDNTTATYINSSVSAERWGVLSTDDCQNVKLTGINSRISIIGDSGYGAYVIGSAVDSFYGCDFDVATYAVIQTGGTANFGASKPETVAKLNTDLNLGLTPEELASIKEKETTINSRRFGIMCWSPGPVNVMDGTVINSKEATFLIRGSASELNVDGSNGVQLNSENGIIIQIMDLDKAGKNMVGDLPVTSAPYTEPYEKYEDIVKDENHDLYAAGSSDVVGNFSNITLVGDFYNGITGGKSSGDAGGFPPGGMPEGGRQGGQPPEGDRQGGAPPGERQVAPGGQQEPGGGQPSFGGERGGAPAGGPPGGNANRDTGKNLVLDFKNTNVTGIITASFARHPKHEFYSDDYQLVGTVTNTPLPAINNGVIVSLDAGSVWTVTGVSYLTKLTLAEGSAVMAPEGRKLSMKVDGAETELNQGTYSGSIVLSVE